MTALLALCGGYHRPLLRGHYQPVEQQSARVFTVIAGRSRYAEPDRYQHHCWVWLQREWQGLPVDMRDRLRSMLQRAVRAKLLEPAAPPRVSVADVAPR